MLLKIVQREFTTKFNKKKYNTCTFGCFKVDFVVFGIVVVVVVIVE